jgi:hypothetical protein
MTRFYDQGLLMRLSLLLASLAALSTAAHAQTAQTPAQMPKPAACPAPGPAPAEFAGFDTPAELTAALTPEAVPQLKPAQAYGVALAPALGVTYALAPTRPPEDKRYAGLTAFTISKAGTYSIAASAGVWFDVLSGGAAIDSTGHHHVDCSSVRKVVDFSLKPGPYILQLSGSPVPRVVIMIAPAP